MQTDVGTSAQPPRLTVPQAEAAARLERELKIGKAILNQRIADVDELALARSEKAEWVLRVRELLTHLFGSPAIAEQWDNWQPIILPEYAEFDMFVDVFGQEMRQRTGRLKSVAKCLPQLSEPMPMQSDPSGSAEEYSPPVETMMNAVKTVAAVTGREGEKAAEARPPRTLSSSGPGRGGVLVSLSPNPAAGKALQLFFQKLGITLAVVERHGPDVPPLIEQLAGMDEVSFALILGVPDPAAAGFWFDLGCCVGRLGGGRVISVGDQEVDAGMPGGIEQIVLDDGEGWQLQLARCLRRSGAEVDLNRLV